VNKKNNAKGARTRRLVLAFPPATVPRPAIDSAAQLARLLGASLFGLFVEDSDLLAAADLPFLRELDARLRAWRPLSYENLLEDYTAMAEALRRQVLQSAAQLGVPAEFSVFRGDPRSAVASGAEPSDVVALFEPVTNWESHKESVSAGTVVFVPRTARPQSGPIVVVAHEATGPEVELASEIASNANIQVVVVDALQEHSSAFWMQRSQRRHARGTGRTDLVASAQHVRQLGLPPASLVVVTRATLERLAQPLESIAGGRSEPWLVLEER